MATIEKRTQSNGSITYRARIRIHGMPGESASFPTRSLAKEWAYRKEVEMKSSRYFPQEEGKNRTFGSFADHYIQNILPKLPKGCAKQTQLIRWWQSKIGKYFLAHISPAMIAKLRDELLEGITPRKAKRTTSTVNRYLAALSRSFNICVKELGWLKENPVLLIKRLKETKARERYLEKEEIDRLLQACQESRCQYLYSIVVFALATGARRGEILNLKWADVDFVYGIALFRETKNGEARSVSLPLHLRECLKLERTKRIIISPFVFPSLDGTKPANIETAWDCAIERSNLPKLRFHDLRHTAASYLAMSGASTLEIGAILGHKTLAMVKRYSHLSTSATAHALARMNEMIFSKAN